MKFLTVLLLGATSVLIQNNIIDQRESQIEKLSTTLKFDKKIQYASEHLEGETSYFKNEENSIKRILMVWDHGSYGGMEKEYYTINNQIIYHRSLEQEWSGESGNQYSLSETIYYFSDDSLGLKTYRQIETFGEELKDTDLEKLESSVKDTSSLEPRDYTRLRTDLTHYENQQLLEK